MASSRVLKRPPNEMYLLYYAIERWRIVSGGLLGKVTMTVSSKKEREHTQL